MDPMINRRVIYTLQKWAALMHFYYMFMSGHYLLFAPATTTKNTISMRSIKAEIMFNKYKQN